MSRNLQEVDRCDLLDISTLEDFGNLDELMTDHNLTAKSDKQQLGVNILNTIQLFNLFYFNLPSFFYQKFN